MAEGDSVDDWDTTGDGAAAVAGMTVLGGNVYFVDYTDNDIYIFSTAGVFDSTLDLHAINTNPYGIATDETYFYVTDIADDKFYKYELDGTYDSAVGLFDRPSGIKYYDGNLYVTDHDDNKLKKYNLAGAFQTEWSLHADNAVPYGATTDGTNWWIVGRTNFKVYKYDMSLNLVDSWDLHINNEPRGIDYDGTNFYVSDWFGHVYVYEGPAAAGTNTQINISDAWKENPAAQVVIDDGGKTWKEVAGMQKVIDDGGKVWKTIF